jgi:hypothetical protein
MGDREHLREWSAIRNEFHGFSVLGTRAAETGLGEINGDLLETDFWPGTTSRQPVIHP